MKSFLKGVVGLAAVAAVGAGICYFVKKYIDEEFDEVEGEDTTEDERDYVTLDIDEEDYDISDFEDDDEDEESDDENSEDENSEDEESDDDYAQPGEVTEADETDEEKL